MNELELLQQRQEWLLAELKNIEERKKLLLVEKDEPEEMEVPRMLTIRKAASEVGLSYDFVYKLCKRHKVVYVKAGSKYLVNMGALYRYLNQGEGKS